MRSSPIWQATVVVLFLFSAAFSEEDPTPWQIFNTFDNSYQQIEDLVLKVRKESRLEKTKITEQWLQYYDKSGKFRIEFLSPPPKRIIVCDGHTYWEYIPDAQKCLKRDLDKMSLEKRAGVLQAALGRVTMPGLRLGMDSSLAGIYDFSIKSKKTTERGVIYNIEGKAKDKSSKSRIELGLNFTKLVVLESAMYDPAGKLNIHTKTDDIREVGDEFYFPFKSVVKSPMKQGLAEATYTIEDVRLNKGIDQEKFKLQLHPDVKIIEK